jgi:branched-chain amino acid transport system ATP-binding protein
MLEVDDIHCAYDNVPVLFGISLEVAEGELVAIVGANGAGKSTTMRSIAGLMHPVRGSIRAKLSVQENLELGAFTEKRRDVIDERLGEVYRLFPILEDRATQTAETLSGGEQQMCAIARGLMSRPKLLMLDELSLGLMPTLVEKVLEAVVEINRGGTTVMLVEQMVQEALEIATRGYVVQTGRIVQSGTAKELLDSEAVRKAYLGL